ncbi:MAG: hypothetical protein JWP21_1044 [Tardiphaga sp.]|nr:hypothetical protein [Tardiphaga sp.]
MPETALQVRCPPISRALLWQGLLLLFHALRRTAKGSGSVGQSSVGQDLRARLVGTGLENLVAGPAQFGRRQPALYFGRGFELPDLGLQRFTFGTPRHFIGHLAFGRCQGRATFFKTSGKIRSIPRHLTLLWEWRRLRLTTGSAGRLYRNRHCRANVPPGGAGLVDARCLTRYASSSYRPGQPAKAGFYASPCRAFLVLAGDVVHIATCLTESDWSSDCQSRRVIMSKSAVRARRP